MNSSYRRLDAFEDVEQGGNRSKKCSRAAKSSGDGSVGFGTSVLASFVQDYASSPAEMLVSKSALREGDGLGSASKQFDALHSPVVLASTNNVPGVIATSPFIKRRKGSTPQLNPGSLQSPMRPTSGEKGEFAAYITMIVLGGTVLLPWKSYITAADYFKGLYPDHPTESIFAVAYMSPLVVLCAVMATVGKKWGFENACLYLALCYAHSYVHRTRARLARREQRRRGAPLSEHTTYIITVCSLTALGTATSVLQTSLYGLAGIFGEKHTQALQSGKGYAGVIIALVRIATKACFGDGWKAVEISTDAYFGLSVVFVLLSFALYGYMTTIPFVKRNLDRAEGNQQSPTADSTSSEDGAWLSPTLLGRLPGSPYIAGASLLSEKDRVHIIESTRRETNVWTVLKKVWRECFAAFYVFVVCIGTFFFFLTKKFDFF